MYHVCGIYLFSYYYETINMILRRHIKSNKNYIIRYTMHCNTYIAYNYRYRQLPRSFDRNMAIRNKNRVIYTNAPQCCVIVAVCTLMFKNCHFCPLKY